VLRISVAACFIGHGAWGVITKEDWLPFFRSQGIPDELAWQLMPLIGIMDILVGIAVLVKPRRVLLLFMMIWALWTAMLRPISGTPGTWEFWERAGNWMPPLMMLMLGGAFAMKAKEWFAGYAEPPLDQDKLGVLHFLGRLTIGLLLIGHGGFGAFVEKPMLIEHFASVGLPADVAFINAVGWFEILLGVAILLRPALPLIWLALIWKILTELLYVTEGGLINSFEFVERAGDYGVPLAMILILNYRRSPRATAG
jgi:uncharacterized membrane protein YphA (DoxX/SURF4 family)